MGREYARQSKRSLKQKEATRALQMAQERRRNKSHAAATDSRPLPTLPPDLQRLIFELLVHEHGRQHVPKLLLVSRSVYEWIRPILYRVIVQFVDPRWETPAETNLPPSSVNVKLDDVCPFAEHLLVGGSRTGDEISQILDASPNVFDLCIWTEKSLRRYLPYLYRISPRRLSATVDSLDPEDFQGPAFANLTHLDVIGWDQESWNTWKNLASIPQLTHLSVNCPVGYQVVLKLLSECKLLQLLVVLKKGSDWLEMKCLNESTYEAAYTTIDDHRLVLLEDTPAGDVSRDWINGARGGMNVWVLAERISYARKNKLLRNCSQRSFSGKPFWELIYAMPDVEWA